MSTKPKRILMAQTNSQYDALNLFTRELAKGFRNRGYEVEIWQSEDDIKRPLERYNTEYSFIFSFNAGFGRIAVLEDLISDRNVPVWHFLVDHPMHHHERLLATGRNSIVSCIDRTHVEYVKKYYKNNQNVTFLPHFGIAPKEKRAFDTKKYDVSFFGSYSSPLHLEKLIAEYNGPLQKLLLQASELLYHDSTLPIDRVFHTLFEEYSLELTDSEFRNIMSELAFIDTYVRMRRRHDIIDTLLMNGIVVNVFGTGWEEFDTDYPENLICHDAMDMECFLEEIADSKIVLNIMPLFPDGSHERVFLTMCAKSVCFTDKNPYLEECFHDKSHLFYYSMDNLTLLAEQVKAVLSGEYPVNDMLERSLNLVMEQHDWQTRADEILAYIDNLSYNNRTYVEENALTDYAFNQLFSYVQNVGADVLKKKLIASHNLFSIHSPKYIEALQRTFSTYPYWGKYVPEENNYEMIDDRIYQLTHHADDLIWLYKRLADYRSRQILTNILLNWETLHPDFLDHNIGEHYPQYFDRDVLDIGRHEVFVDLGAYIGDTLEAFLHETMYQYDKIICYEASPRNADELKEQFSQTENLTIRACAVGKEHGYADMSNENTDFSSDRISVSDKGGIEVVSLDEDITECITFIKSDIEGAEYDALLGARRHISEEHPKLAISIYHGNKDIWRLAKLIDEMDSSYRFYIRYYGGNLYPNEIVLYGV